MTTPTHTRTPPHGHLCLAAAALVLVGACNHKDPKTGLRYFEVSTVGLRVPMLDGWVRERSAESKDADSGGVLLRLVRKQAVAGSPRIDVVAERKTEWPTNIEDFLTRNLREMAQLEQSGALRITNVDQRPISVGPRRGYRVRHEYILSGSQVAITQVSALLVVDGRGITITAVGRTELFAPLAASIEVMLSGLRTPVPEARPAKAPAPALHREAPLTEPIDLGKLGGKK